MSKDNHRFSTRLAALEEASVNLRVQIRSRSRGRPKHRAAFDLDISSLPNSPLGTPITSRFGLLKETSVLGKEESVVGGKAEERRGRGVKQALAALEGIHNRTSPQIARDGLSMLGEGEKVAESMRIDTGHVDGSKDASIVAGDESSLHIKEDMHGQYGIKGEDTPHVEQEETTANGIEEEDSRHVKEQSRTMPAESLTAVPPTPVPLGGISDSMDGARDLDGSDDVATSSLQTTEQTSNAPSEQEAHEEPAKDPIPRKKISGPFSWLTRNKSGGLDKNVKSQPSASSRRNTASSLATTGSASDTMLMSKIDDDDESQASSTKRPGLKSLQDRFKLVRMREEAGIDLVESQNGDKSNTSNRHKSADTSLTLPPAELDLAGSSSRRSSTNIASPVNPPTINESMAPGTAAGTVAGPSTDHEDPVNWDLWQAVVCEGPAAVARTSADELSQAIAHGIPSAIRGVVWQVLAQSKNEELEVVYRELVARGTEKERRPSWLKPRPSDLNRQESNVAMNGNSKEKENVMSSASSIHSNDSSPTSPSSNLVITSPPTSQDGSNIEALAKAQSIAVNEAKQKAKNEASALQRLERAIRRDLGARTSYSKFVMAAGLQDGLFGVCKAYALFDEAVGYAQGMSFIAMPLLFNMSEEEAFCLFVRLMNHFHLRELFIQDMPGLHLHLYQFDRLLEDFEPAVYCHLHRRGVKPELYATQWFLTLFAYRFPLQLVLRIYDLILSEGLERAILKFGIVLMQKNAESLLGMKDMAELTTFLKERLFDVYIDKNPSASSKLESGFFGSAGGIDREIYRADALVQDACAIKITPETLKTYATEWEEIVRDEKEKQSESDTLRSTNASLSLQLRALESLHESHDREHVAIASELIRTKVENQLLVDTNESLTTQVAALQEVVQAQPGEVEGKLRGEMERIMKRNIEVQNENRALEEGCAEMEGELVKAKLEVANMREEVEWLRGTWRDVSKMMDSAKSP